jgi:hypothetical protein
VTAAKSTTPETPEAKDDETNSEAITPASTTLDKSVEKPSVTAPGDGPADTTDPTERATSVTPNPDETAIAAGTVNAVKPIPKPEAKKSTVKARTETYKAPKPDGTVVTVVRNIETGETTVKD